MSCCSQSIKLLSGLTNNFLFLFKCCSISGIGKFIRLILIVTYKAYNTPGSLLYTEFTNF